MVLACRSVSKGEQLKQALVQEAQACGTAHPQVEVQVLDLASLASVRAFATAWQGRPLHILINNAGLFGLGGEHACSMPSLVPGQAARPRAIAALCCLRASALPCESQQLPAHQQCFTRGSYPTTPAMRAHPACLPHPLPPCRTRH